MAYLNQDFDNFGLAQPVKKSGGPTLHELTRLRYLSQITESRPCKRSLLISASLGFIQPSSYGGCSSWHTTI